MRRTRSVPLNLVCLCFLVSACGCGDGKLPVAKVKGTVLYEGEPLKYGSVMFKPLEGPPAKGSIKSDGTFVLGTYTEDDGAILGRHQIQVRCFKSQDPDAPPPDPKKEDFLGRSQIPKKYNMWQTSGLRADITENNEPIVIELK